LSYITFIMLRNVLFILSFFKAFVMKGCWTLSKTFSASMEIVMWFYLGFCFCLLIWMCCAILTSLEWNLDRDAWSF
jgi:hypothetical protein